MKRYHQYCPIACSLELVGERWTLLVVRELFYGPKRYTDLAGGLPGIGLRGGGRRVPGRGNGNGTGFWKSAPVSRPTREPAVPPGSAGSRWSRPGSRPRGRTPRAASG